MQIPAPDLSQLRDIHLPSPITDFPIAFGWWLLLIICVLLIAAGFIYGLKWHAKNRTKKAALLLLTQQYQQFKQNKDTQLFLQQCNQILKRYCLEKHPQAVSLSGEAWLSFLNRSSTKTYFNADLNQAISQGLYESHCEFNAHALHKACAGWIKNNKGNSHD